jgi:hypothetical protein
MVNVTRVIWPRAFIFFVTEIIEDLYTVLETTQTVPEARRLLQALKLAPLGLSAVMCAFVGQWRHGSSV